MKFKQLVLAIALALTSLVIMKTFGEWDDQTKTHIFHAVKSSQPYHFIWTPTQFTESSLELRFLRLRFTQPNFTLPGAGECSPKGNG
jgi:predicted transposase YdaD